MFCVVLPYVFLFFALSENLGFFLCSFLSDYNSYNIVAETPAGLAKENLNVSVNKDLLIISGFVYISLFVRFPSPGLILLRAQVNRNKNKNNKAQTGLDVKDLMANCMSEFRYCLSFVPFYCFVFLVFLSRTLSSFFSPFIPLFSSERSVRLPSYVDSENIEAKMEGSQLKISIPKLEQAQAGRKIAIS